MINVKNVKQEESEEKVKIVVRNIRMSRPKDHFRYGILYSNMQCKMM